MLSRDNASQAIVSGLPTVRPGMPEETLAGYNARSWTRAGAQIGFGEATWQWQRLNYRQSLISGAS